MSSPAILDIHEIDAILKTQNFIFQPHPIPKQNPASNLPEALSKTWSVARKARRSGAALARLVCAFAARRKPEDDHCYGWLLRPHQQQN
jgi:hypothetical protein